MDRLAANKIKSRVVTRNGRVFTRQCGNSLRGASWNKLNVNCLAMWYNTSSDILPHRLDNAVSYYQTSLFTTRVIHNIHKIIPDANFHDSFIVKYSFISSRRLPWMLGIIDTYYIYITWVKKSDDNKIPILTLCNFRHLDLTQYNFDLNDFRMNC